MILLNLFKYKKYENIRLRSMLFKKNTVTNITNIASA